MPETILPRTIEDDMRESYLDYAMSVIVGRAIPDARDGLKPVHRRILFAMHEMGNTFDKPHKKSARAIGECLGKFHPHGDVAIYDALIRMAQDFSLRYPLIHGQGNMGSIDGDSPASMRYCVTGNTLIVTEKGMERIGELSDKEDIERMVLSIDNKVNTASKWFDSGTHRTKTINTRRGFHLTGTLNHPILVWSKNAKGKPRLNWKLIQNLKNGDYAVISRAPLLFPKEEPKLKKYHPLLKSNRERKMLPKTMGPDLALLLGMIVAEGSVCKHNIGFCNSDDEFLQIFKKIFKRVFPDCRLHEYVRKPVGYTKKPYTSLEIHSHHVVEFFKNLGLEPVRAKKKEIPKIMWQTSKESLAAFIRGYAEGDGSVYRYGGPEITFTSVSAELLKELQILLLRFGINSSYNYQPSRKTYKILIRGVDSHSLFKDQIDFLTKRKIKKLEEICELNKDMRIFSQTDYVPYVAEYMRNNGYKGKSREWLIKHNIDRVPKIKRYQKTLFEILNEADKTLYADILSNNYIFDEITSITDSGFQKVYSIRVDSNCHSFVSNGFISHNTEVRLAKIAEDILADLEKETVDWMDNFDATLKEPIVMPSRIPNLLINGTSGIAVGMATNIPPHNLTEIIDGTIAVIEGADESKLLMIVNGPDFPTGGEILGRSGIMQAYKTGRGIIRIRGKAHVDAKRNAIVITEIPYQVTKTAIIEAIAEAVKNKRIEGISGVHDRSDKDGIEVLVDLKKSAIGEVVLNQIYAHTPLEGTFGIINLVLVGKQPKVLGIYPLINEFVEFRKEVVRKRCLFELKQAEERAHILEGLRTALENIDAIVVFLKKTKDIAEARAGLMKQYSLSEKQANAILDMKISRLVALERQKIEDEYAGLVKTIAWLKDVLADINKILKIIKDELLEVKAKYGDARRTTILEAEGEVTDESLIPNEQVVIPISGRGYVKRVGLDEYRTQHRGGKGVMGAETKGEDFVQDVIVVRNHNYILFFTDKGRVFWLKAYQIPEAGRYATGKSLVNLLDLKEEKVSSWIPVPEFKPNEYLVMVTKNGIVKRTSLDDFSHPRKNGIIAITLRDADQLVEVIKTDGKEELLIATKQGQAIRFDENDAREIGRAGMGVIGIRLKDKDDAVVGVASCKKYPSVLTITENGYGKRTATDEYRLQGRGGSGVINIKTEGRNGSVVSVRGVVDTDEVIVISSKGQTIRSPVTDISVIGRNTQGVRIIRLQEEEGEKVASFAVVPKEEKVEEVKSPSEQKD